MSPRNLDDSLVPHPLRFRSARHQFHERLLELREIDWLREMHAETRFT